MRFGSHLLRHWPIIVPLAGAATFASLPFIWTGQGVADERAAVQALVAVSDAQERFRAETGGYAATFESLTGRCAGEAAARIAAAMTQAAGAGYALSLRVAANATPAGVDCDGRPLTADYYVATRPLHGETNAQRAYAMRSDGRVFLFFDGVPPRESDMASGLATALEDLSEFRIP